MTVRRFLGSYLAALVVFLVVDGLWIGLVATRVYAAQMPELVRDDPLLAPAALFYLGFVAVLVHLAVGPALAGAASSGPATTGQATTGRPRGGAVARSAVTGGVVGVTAYGTYALTALAVIEGFSVAVAVLDLVWGGVLGAAVAAGTTAIVLTASVRRPARHA